MKKRESTSFEVAIEAGKISEGNNFVRIYFCKSESGQIFTAVVKSYKM